MTKPLPKGQKTEPWEHQREAGRFAYRRDGTLLAMDMGTGKSLTAILLAHAWGCRRILITCPLSVVGVWPREFREHSDLYWEVARCDKRGVESKEAKADGALALARALGKPYVCVVNHETLWREPFASFVKRTKWDLLIVDECHRAKMPGGKLSRFLYQISNLFPRRLGLTGTPLPHSPMDLYAQARFLDRSVSGKTFVQFRNRYALMGGYERREVVGFQRTGEFSEKFHTLAFEKKKEDCLDLPEEIDETRLCVLEPKARKAYRQLETRFWAEVEGGEVTVANALVKLLRLQQMTSGDLPLDDGTLEEISQAKSKLLADTLEDISKPVVVVCRFHADLDRVKYISGVLGKTYAEVSGRLKDGLDDDARMVSGIDVLGAQIQAGGLGIDLTRSALAILYSVGFSLGDYKQVRARLHRPGQRSNVTFLHLVVEDSIDEVVLHALRRREQVIETILKKGRRE